jgi:acyl-CoA synthetase (NDP forming)
MMLSELESKSLLSGYGIPVNEEHEADSAGQAAKAAKRIGFPVAVKVLSRKITHKSDEGLVALGIDKPAKVLEAYERIIEKARSIDPGAKVAVEAMASPGTEVIVGAKRDPQFGPIVLFGLGGIFVEVFKDVSIRVAPVDHRMALSMMKGLKGYKLLEGYRGNKGVDMDKLADIVVNVSRLMMSRDDIQELDINPVIAHENGAVAVDARIIVKDKKDV